MRASSLRGASSRRKRQQFRRLREKKEMFRERTRITTEIAFGLGTGYCASSGSRLCCPRG